MTSRARKPATSANTAGLAVAVHEALEELTLRPEDVAAAELARRYARTIDAAAALAEAAAGIPYDPDTAVQVARLADRVQAHVVMLELGPKLLAVLDALHATPGARAKVAKPKAGATGAGKLSALRGGKAAG